MVKCLTSGKQTTTQTMDTKEKIEKRWMNDGWCDVGARILLCSVHTHTQTRTNRAKEAKKKRREKKCVSSFLFLLLSH